MQLVIETALGDVVCKLHSDKAPLTTQFVLDLVNRNYYAGGDIYRATDLGIQDGPYLLQAGVALPFLQDKKAGRETPMLEQIERTGSTGLLHHRGTLSLARDLNRTGKVIPETFVCLGDFPSLDENGRDWPDTQGFPAFGEVISGLALLDKIAAEETKGHTHLPLLEGQMLSSPVGVKRVYAS